MARFGAPLSVREQQVLEKVASGLSNKQIARELGLSVHTVKDYVGAILIKLGSPNRAAAARRWTPPPIRGIVRMDSFFLACLNRFPSRSRV